jgi:hypothetical protein
MKIEDLILGRYTVEETIPPAGYHIGNPPGAGPHTFPDMTLASLDVSLGVTFVNLKAFRNIVITCDDITDTLVDGTVEIDGVMLQTMSAADLASLGWLNASGGALSESDFCNQGGASYGGLDEGVYQAAVEVSDRAPFFPF